MKTNHLVRTGAITAAALSLSLGLVACGQDDSGAASGSGGSSSSESNESSESSEMESSGTSGSGESGTMTEAGGQTFGPGCSAIPTSGAGSFDGMVKDPVATAASNNPLLSTLVTAVTEADLVDTLNGAEGLTVFAPTNDAFAKIPEATLNKVLADKKLLTTILTHHVVAGQMDPSAVVGSQDTLAKDSVEVTGDTKGMKVDDASVLCGNIPTANATVYVVDTVLMPKGM